MTPLVWRPARYAAGVQVMVEDESNITEVQATDQIAEDEPLVTEGMDWFVLRVASNKEDQVRRTLLRKIKI